MPNPGRHGSKRLLLVVEMVVSLGVVVGVFAGILPRIADYSAVWATIRSLTWFELLSLFAITALHSIAVLPQMVASLPGLTLAQAAVNNQASTTVSNVLPGGSMFAAGVTYALFRSWGFADSAIALSALITFAWNTFFKLALPVVALAILAIQGEGSGGLMVASLAGLAVLAVTVVLLFTMRWRTTLTGQVGSLTGSVASFLRRLIHKPPVGDWAEAAVRLRGEAARLVGARWVALTLSTVATHVTVYLVLVLAVRDVGISAREVSWTRILGVFAFVRLLSAIPITPGGLGIVDLGYIGGLVLAGRHQADVPVDVFHAQVTAAVLVFRAFTYGLQLPHGALAYFIWQRQKGWRKAPPHGPPVAPAPGHEAAESAPR
ncbi:MAG TPA: lysylphosphatidylglycerol synthase transmembrane domain-containing protein [Actinomycetota bacterium]|nr:lysylphosphatidylglycerol synthase transmembrane domain-containing protein [Actinomycetota bacterium]